MKDSDVLPYLPTDKLPPVKESLTRRARLSRWIRHRRLYQGLNWLTKPAQAKVRLTWKLHPRLFVLGLVLALVVAPAGVLAVFNLGGTSSGNVGTTQGTITGTPTITVTNGTPGTCTVSANKQSFSCTGTNLTAVGDSYTLTFTITDTPPNTATPVCTASATGTAFTAGSPTVTGTGPFTVSELASAAASGSGSITVSC